MKKRAETLSSWYIVFPNDANPLGTMFGGRIMSIMDEMAGIAASRFSGYTSVTASTEAIIFREPVKVGDRIEVLARVVWVGNTSMVVKVEVYAENPIQNRKRVRCTSAHFNMVALDRKGKTVKVNDILLETDQDKQDYEIAEIVKKQALNYINVENISKSYGELTLFKDLSFSIQEKE